MKDRGLAALGEAFCLLPRGSALAAGRRIGDLLGLIARDRRRLALANLGAALGEEMDEPQRRALIRRVFRHFGEALVETLLLPQMVKSDILRYVTHEGWEHLERATRGGSGAIVFTGHFGNWEVVALAQGARGIPMDVVGRPPNDADVARRLERTRRLTGNRFIPKRDAARPMLRSLREGRTVGLVVDQNVRGGHGVFVDFFGRQAATTPALAVVALRTGVPVIPVFGYPEKGRHRIVYEPPLVLEPSGDLNRDVWELTSRVTHIIEEHVRRDPHLWMWLHNRWRSRPEGEEAAGEAETEEPPWASGGVG